MNEAAIRDLLVDQLDCLEAGLVLLNIEQYIPSDIGTRSFIDILCRDKDNNWVIIELKRSDAAARQAIHEVLKYAEAVKTHLGVRNDEIRIIIVSTIWTELLIPFSRFISESALDISGLNLDNTQPQALTAEAVTPLKMNNGRALSPWHEVNLYTSQESLKEGIESYRAANTAKGIHDYILIIMKAPDGHLL